MTARAARVGALSREREVTTKGAAEGGIATTANAPRHDAQCECGEWPGLGAGTSESVLAPRGGASTPLPDGKSERAAVQ
jgi:hypothetical protein